MRHSSGDPVYHSIIKSFKIIYPGRLRIIGRSQETCQKNAKHSVFGGKAMQQS